MKAYYIYDIHDLITIKSNIPVAPSLFLKRHLKHADIEVYRDSGLGVPLLSLTPLGLRLFYDKNTLIHKCRFFLDAHLEIRETGSQTVLRFNRMYELVRNPLQFFLAFLQMRLLDKDFAFIHAGAVANNSECLLFPAFSDTGKTTTTLLFLGDGYSFLGDDKIITDGQSIFSYPAPIRKTLVRPFQKIPFLRRFTLKRIISPITTRKAIPKELFFLKIGKKAEIREIDKEEIAEKANIMTESTCPLFPYPTGVMLGYYFIRDIKLNTYIAKRKKILLQLINNCKTFMVTANGSSEFYRLIKKKKKGNCEK